MGYHLIEFSYFSYGEETFLFNFGAVLTQAGSKRNLDVKSLLVCSSTLPKSPQRLTMKARVALDEQSLLKCGLWALLQQNPGDGEGLCV